MRPQMRWNLISFHITIELRRFACLNTHSSLLQSCSFLLETGHIVLQFLAFLQLWLCDTVLVNGNQMLGLPEKNLAKTSEKKKRQMTFSFATFFFLPKVGAQKYNTLVCYLLNFSLLKKKKRVLWAFLILMIHRAKQIDHTIHMSHTLSSNHGDETPWNNISISYFPISQLGAEVSWKRI